MTSFSKSDGQKIVELETVALGALANQAAIKLTQLTFTEDFRTLKQEIYALIKSIDDEDDITGLMFGIADNELSVTEIAEALAIQGPVDPSDNLKKERAARWVRILSGALVINPVGPNSTQATVEGNFVNKEHGGPCIINKDPWTYSDAASGWCFFIWNNTGSVMITGAQARVHATTFGVWVQ